MYVEDPDLRSRLHDTHMPGSTACEGGTIRTVLLGDGSYEVDYDYCKGCGLRAAGCPCGTIGVRPEPA